MNGWDLMTWISVAILGPGSVVIFVAFLHDLKTVLRAPEKDRTNDSRGRRPTAPPPTPIR